MRATSCRVFQTSAPVAGLSANTRPLPRPLPNLPPGSSGRPTSGAARITNAPCFWLGATATLAARPYDEGLHVNLDVRGLSPLGGYCHSGADRKSTRLNSSHTD